MRRFLVILFALSTTALLPGDPGAEGKNRLPRPPVSTVVDSSALNFVEGTVGSCINGQTFQQEALVSFNGFQYAAYFVDGTAHGSDKGILALARRKLPDGPWEVIHFTDDKLECVLTPNDAHNVAVVGICPEDGTIHLSFDHHESILRYKKSVPGLASRPKDFQWEAGHFSKTVNGLEPGKPRRRVTYPTFFSTPQGKLQFLYRIGHSGNGDWYLAEYDPSAGWWKTLGMLFSKEGVYQGKANQVSRTRCAYPHPVRYAPDGRLHITWSWRERPKGGIGGGIVDLRTNHDLCYAWSEDFGRTWKNNAGDTIARLGPGAEGSISLDSPGIVVAKTQFLWGQMNTVTQWIDSQNRIHVIHWQNPEEAPKWSKNLNDWRFDHYWRDPDGVWHSQRLPFFGRKPQILTDTTGRAFVIFTKGDDLNYARRADPGGPLVIMTAPETGGWRDWQELWRSDQLFVGEPLIDAGRWRESGVLSIYAQEKPEAAGKPSRLLVLDFAAPLFDNPK